MPDYQAGNPIVKVKDNIIAREDGTIMAIYLLDGVNVSAGDPSTIDSATASHERLFTALSKLPAEEFTIHSLKHRIPTEDALARVRRSFPEDYTPEKYPYLTQKLAAFAARLDSGALIQFDRTYILSARLSSPVTLQAKFLNLFVAKDPLEDVDWDMIRRREKEYFEQLPRDFNPRRGDMRILRWAHDRASTRGIDVPPLPDPVDGVMPGPSAFSPITVGAYAQTEALTDDFVTRLEEIDEEDLIKAKKARFRDHYRNLRFATTMEVTNPETATADMPAGQVSYQAHIVVEYYPTDIRTLGDLSGFTHMVDSGATGVDADWSMFFTYDWDLLDRKEMRKRERLHEYYASEAKDHFDVADESERGGELAQFHDLSHALTHPVPMRVAFMFTLAYSDREYLEEQVDDVLSRLDRAGYRARTIPGGQREMFYASMPAGAAPALIKAYHQGTTAQTLAPAVMLRTSRAGDPQGIPRAINREDANGRIVFTDLLSRPDAGSPSTLTLGGLGSGKSYHAKDLGAWCLALHTYIHVIDPSGHGEYSRFFTQLQGLDPFIRTETIDLAHCVRSFDPIKLYSDNDDMLRAMFIATVLPLLNLSESSAGGARLLDGLAKGTREAYGVKSTRDLFERYVGAFASEKSTEKAGQELYEAWRRADFVSSLPTGRALIDPRGHNLPRLETHATCVVFLINNLDLPDTKEEERENLSQRVAARLLDAVALYTRYRFTRVPQLCTLLADEAHVFSRSPVVMKNLVVKPVNMGRKESMQFYGISQDGDHFNDSDIQAIPNFNVLRIDKIERAAIAARKSGLISPPPGDTGESYPIVRSIAEDLSPQDPGRNRVVPGREGEAWMVELGRPPMRVKFLPMLLAAENQAADTTASALAAEKMAEGDWS